MSKLFDLPTTNALYALAGLLATLLFATIIIYALKYSKPKKNWHELVLRIKSWWFIYGFFLIVMFGQKHIAITAVSVLSFFALREYFRLINHNKDDSKVLLWAYLAIVGQCYFILTAWYKMFILFIPVYVFLLLPFRMILIGRTSDYLKRISTIQWGLFLTVFSLGHIAYLFNLDNIINPAGHAQGLLIYIIALTELNDIAQFCWGKALGKRKIVPMISPNKTWAGFLGGVVTTTVLSALVAPYLTPMDFHHALFCGFLIGICGFIGDVNISAVKRDIGVKDSGTAIPGHGGILDRIDSLTYTAPVFFHFIYYFYY